MATYDNKHWLLSHIRNSFISTDDTGMCEIVMIGEDFPRLLHAKSMMDKVEQSSSPLKNCEDTSEDEYERERVMEFDCYPEMDVSDDDDIDPLTESYDLQHDMEFGMHRQRSNTAQRLEKMDQAQRKAARIKMVKWENPPIHVAGQEREHLFARKEIKVDSMKCNIGGGGVPQRRSMLSDLLEKCPFLPQSQYLAYAKIDGTAQLGLPTKTFKIFMTMMTEALRNYPIHVCVVASAKIEELIGFTCYKYSIAHPEVTLGPVSNYGLCISEDDGEVDWDFPCLDSKEPCSKFGLTCLGLVDLKTYALAKNSEAHTSSIPEKGGFNAITLPDDTKSTDHAARSRSATFDSKDKPKSQEGVHIRGIVNKNGRGVQRTSSSVTFGEDTTRTVSVLVDNLPRREPSDPSDDSRSAPAGTHSHFDFAMGVQSPQESAALRRMKLHEQDVDAPLYQSFRVHLVNRVRSNTEVLLGISKERIEINPLPKGSSKFWYRMKPVSYNMDSIAWCEKFEPKNNRSVFRMVYYQAVSADSSSLEGSPSTPIFKHHDFECDLLSSFLIVNKINRILELQSNACRKEYKAAYDRKLQARRSFHLHKKI